MKKENLPKCELLKLIDSFEYYPAVTPEDDRVYILAYLDDEACSIGQEEIKQYLDNIIITKDDIHLYYEFMIDEDLEKHLDIIYTVRMERAVKVQMALNLTPKELFNNAGDNGIFRIKDTLKPIGEYIEEIKESSEYKEYIKSIILNDVCVSYEAEGQHGENIVVVNDMETFNKLCLEHKVSFDCIAWDGAVNTCPCCGVLYNVEDLIQLENDIICESCNED